MRRREEVRTPPRLARRILAVLVGSRHADDVGPALSELYRERLERDGRRTAGRWYWRQVAGFGLRWRAFNTGGRGRGTMDAWTRDLRLAIRSLTRTPAFTAVAILTLALGIGANTAIFSVIHGSLLRRLPYAEPDRLVWLSDGHPSFGGTGVDESVPNLTDLRAGSKLMRSSAIYRVLGGNVATGERAERIPILFASSEMLGVLGIPPALGRDLLPGDDNVDAETVTILTDDLWRSWFGADPKVVGRTVIVDARPVRIVGVLPPQFAFPGEPKLLLPLQHVGADLSRRNRGYFGVARLAPGADVAGLRAELQGIFARLEKAYPEANEGWYTWAEPLRDYVVGRNQRSLLLLGGAVALVLLIACVNVANLLLVRAETRHHELAVRYSLGARRSALVSLFLGEGLVLSLAGGALGMASAYWGVDLLVALYGGTLARADLIGVDGLVLAFGLATTLLVGLAVGLVPLLRLRPDDLREFLTDGARGASVRGSAVGRVLVVAEVALAVLVVAGAGLLANSMWRLQRVELGVSDPERVMTFTMSLPAAAYPDAAAIGGFADELGARLQAVPGVRVVGLVNRLPLLGGDNTNVTVFGDPTREADFTSVRLVTPGFFAAVGVSLVAGRWLHDAEFRGTTSSVVINQTLARRLFGGEDPLGRRIDPHFLDGGLVVVGVCGDIAGGRPDRPAPPAFYFPLATALQLWASQPRQANDYWGMSALVRADADPRTSVPAFRRAVAAIDASLPVSDVRTLQDIAVDRLGTRRFAMSLFGVFAGLALLLGSVGIYGVMSFAVAQRSRELGMRLALGASRGSVLRLVLGQGARLTAPGLILGLAAALASARVLGNLLFEVSPLDPWTYTLVAGVLTLVALAATSVPALRATRVDPVTSIRGE